MKRSKIFFLLFSLLFFMSSCVQVNSETDEPKKDGPDVSDDETVILFENKSNFNVKIYYDINPYFNEKVFADVPAASKIKKDFSYKENYSETFFIVYDLTFGGSSAVFPFFSEDDKINHKSIKVEKDVENKIVIDDIAECTTTSAYVFLENKTSSSIYLLSGITPITPYLADSKFVKTDDVGVYEIGKTGNLTLASFNNCKVVINSENYEMLDVELKPGNIYTITVSNDDKGGVFTSLKSVTPFNIDTQKKIWARETMKGSNLDVGLVRPRRDINNGCACACVSDKYPKFVIMKEIDVYGKTTRQDNVGIKEAVLHDGEEPVSVTFVSPVDFLETSDGSYAILSYMEYEDSNKKKGSVYVLFIYNFNNTTLKNVLYIDNYIPQYNLFIDNSNNNQGLLLELEENVFAICGGCYNSPDDVNYYCNSFILKLDLNEMSATSFVTASSERTDMQPDENEIPLYDSCFNSMYFDGNDLYVAGVKNRDVNYFNVSKPYTGVIYKVSKDLMTQEKIVEEENMLFLGIAGNKKKTKFYACGESYENGAIQKGFLVSSDNIVNGKFLIKSKYVAKDYPYCWFNQLSVCECGVVCSGVASEARDSLDGKPIVVAYDEKTCGEIWENTDYDGYQCAKCCFENSIGTYTIHLSGLNLMGKSYSCLVNADLLGKAPKATAYIE